MLMMLAPASRGNSGSAARVTRKTPSTFVCNIVSQSTSLPVAMVSAPCAPPALFISTCKAGLDRRPGEIIFPAQAMKFSTLKVLETSSS